MPYVPRATIAWSRRPQLSREKCNPDPRPNIISSPTERASPPVPRERLETHLCTIDTSSIRRRTRRTRAVKHPRRVDDTEVRLAEIYLENSRESNQQTPSAPMGSSGDAPVRCPTPFAHGPASPTRGCASSGTPPRWQTLLNRLSSANPLAHTPGAVGLHHLSLSRVSANARQNRQRHPPSPLAARPADAASRRARSVHVHTRIRSHTGGLIPTAVQAPRGAASQPALQDRVTKDGGADRHRGFTSRGSREGTYPRGTTGRARRGEGGEEARGGYARRGTTRGAVTRGDPRAPSTRPNRLAERRLRFRRILERLQWGDVFAELTGNKREGFWKQT